MSERLEKISNIQAGYGFRGKIAEDEDGSVSVIQIRDVDDDGSIQWDKLIKTHLPSEKPQHFLKENDIIFTARGPRNVASFIDGSHPKTVCSPHFFVIRIHDPEWVPEFVAWQLNQKQAQQYFSRSAVGSSQISISKGTLGATTITYLGPDPEKQKQKDIVSLHRSVMQEKNLLKALINNRAKQMDGLADSILGAE
jgi:restriction endonuclease S subunit